jgi:lactate dehydrogenase-like 2-hydroxyacid dehydrogenase
MGLSVYVTRQIARPALDLLRQECQTVEVHGEDRSLTKQELLNALPGHNGILSMATDPIDDEVLAAAHAEGIAIFANCAVGYDNIDVTAATRRGIMITNTPGVLTDTTADLTWALMLAVARHIASSDRFLRAGRWAGFSPGLFLGSDVSGKTLGVVGAGRIGTAVALRSAGFDMKVLYTDPISNAVLEEKARARRVDLATLLREADFVSIHVALSPDTRHLIGEKELTQMKPTAYLVNTSRGPVVDEIALLSALQKGLIAGAGLDVFEREPNVPPSLIKLDSVVLTPHIGSATTETRTKMAMLAAENLLCGLRGERPPNLVNPDASQGS